MWIFDKWQRYCLARPYQRGAKLQGTCTLHRKLPAGHEPAYLLSNAGVKSARLTSCQNWPLPQRMTRISHQHTPPAPNAGVVVAPKPLPPGMPKAGEEAAEQNAGELDAPKPPPNAGVAGVAPKPPNEGDAGCAAPKPPGVDAAPKVGCAQQMEHNRHREGRHVWESVTCCMLKAARRRHYIRV